jgi:hypothetical protein
VISSTSRAEGETRDARQHRVADHHRELDTRLQQLADEKGVATRLAVQLVRFDRRIPGEVRHGLERKRCEAQPAHSRLGGEVAQQDAQRMARADLVVAQGGHH